MIGNNSNNSGKNSCGGNQIMNIKMKLIRKI